MTYSVNDATVLYKSVHASKELGFAKAGTSSKRSALNQMKGVLFETITPHGQMMVSSFYDIMYDNHALGRV